MPYNGFTIFLIYVREDQRRRGGISGAGQQSRVGAKAKYYVLFCEALSNSIDREDFGP